MRNGGAYAPTPTAARGRLSGAGIASGLSAVGATVGGGMGAGAVVVAVAPAAAVAAVGYGIYRIWRLLDA